MNTILTVWGAALAVAGYVLLTPPGRRAPGWRVVELIKAGKAVGWWFYRRAFGQARVLRPCGLRLAYGDSPCRRWRAHDWHRSRIGDHSFTWRPPSRPPAPPPPPARNPGYRNVETEVRAAVAFRFGIAAAEARAATERFQAAVASGQWVRVINDPPEPVGWVSIPCDDPGDGR